MTPWLTFVVGIIVGLVIGWLIEMLYRRAPRAEPAEQPDRTPEWAQPLPAMAVAADSDGLDVPPGSETAEATEAVDWRAISARVDEVAGEVDERPSTAAQISSELPDEDALPPAAADALAPPAEDDEEARGWSR